MELVLRQGDRITIEWERWGCGGGGFPGLVQRGGWWLCCSEGCAVGGLQEGWSGAGGEVMKNKGWWRWWWWCWGWTGEQ